MEGPLRVCVTGAAGQIAYSLLRMIGSGEMFGPDQPIALLLLDIKPMMEIVEGVVMELEDCSLPLLHSVVGTHKVETAFENIDVAILVGAMPRKEGMERKDLLKANAKIFKDQGEALNKFAKKSVKVLVVGNPANTNCLIAASCAPTIPKENFTCMTKLDQNRAVSQVAMRLGVKADVVKKVSESFFLKIITIRNKKIYAVNLIRNLWNVGKLAESIRETCSRDLAHYG